MANVTFNKKTFEKEIGVLDERMQEKIALFGTPVEHVDENELTLEIFPNRPDLLSYHGFKRSFLSFLEKKPGLKPYKVNAPEKTYVVKIDSSVKSVRPFTACAIVKNVKFTDEAIKELIDLQEKLHNTLGRRRKKAAIGVYPLESIALPLTYKAIEPDQIRFVPLEGSREMSGLEILQRHQTGKEYAHLLAGKEKFPVFVDAHNQILSMPPIINAEHTGRVTTTTKDVFVECSGFDFALLKKILTIVVTTLADMGGAIYAMELRYSKKETTPDLACEEHPFSLERAQKQLGITLDEKSVKKLFAKMGYGYVKKNVVAPPWRVDILHECDLVEDLAIAYGYERFEPTFPLLGGVGEADKREIKKRSIGEILCGLGYLETSSYHLSKKRDQYDAMGAKQEENDALAVETSKTDYTLLRRDLTHCALKIFSENVDEEYPQKLFEMGTVFAREKGINEKTHLVFSCAPGNFTQIKQTLQYLGAMFDCSFDVKEPKSAPAHFIDGRAAEVFLGGKSVGFLGEIHPKILKNWRIKMPVALCEIDVEEILERD